MTEEELIADAKADKTRTDLIFEGWWECDCGCDALYDPNEEKIEIQKHTYSLKCLREEYGLVPLTDVKKAIGAGL